VTVALSAAQLAVVQHRGADLQVIACAGSGKTESVSRRIAALIEEGAEPASIVAFTFTERAAAELKERIVRRVAERMGAAFRDRLGPMFVGTIHAYCFRVLQDHVPRYGSYDVLDDNRHAGLLSREHKAIGLSRLGSKHWQPIRDFAKAVDVIGNELIPTSAFDGTPLGECLRAYREILDRFHFLTFSTIISAAVEALEDPAVHARALGGLRHLIVDEYQDINPAQQRLIELMAQPPVSLCVVGDDDQSIYQWRGSDVSHIVHFADRRAGAVTVTLDANRRSRPGIVAAASAFARSIPDRLTKDMTPVRPAGDVELIAWSAETERDEAERVADTIARLHAQGFRYRDVAVLFRSVRTSAPPLLEALEARGIPYACAGRTGLFLQPEILLFGEIFAWFVDGDWKETRYGDARPADLDHIVIELSRHFGGGQPIAGLRTYLEDWKAFQLRGLRTVNLVDDFYRLLSKLGVQSIDPDTPIGAARLGAYARFSEILADFEHVQRRGYRVHGEGDGEDGRFQAGRDRGKWYFLSLYNYLQHWARDAYEDFAGETIVELDAVDILTVHQAKGLEWPVVFLPALVNGRFPSARSGRPQDWLVPEDVFPAATRARYEGSDAEERRLFYVALTRARDVVYLSCFGRKARRFQPSPYLLEVAGGPLVTGELPLPGIVTAPTVTEPPVAEISFSDLARLDDCGYAYRLGSSLGYQQPLAVELGYGKAIHHVLRQLAEVTRADGAVPGSEGLDALVDAEFYVPFASATGYEQMRKAASRLVERYVADYHDDLARVWELERPFALHFEEGVVSGRADVILDRENGLPSRLAIVDYKVSSDPGREERYRLQLAVYAAAGRGEGLAVEAAYLHELREGARHPVDIGPAATADAAVRVRSLLVRAREGDFPPRPEHGRCGSCDYRRICRHTVVTD
jgi:DNA helicase-2/ATP-dependent DNA helicase PcrA